MAKFCNLTCSDFWAIFLTKYADGFPALSSHGTIYLTQPPTTVEAERGFSRQNLIKTALRTNLSGDRVNKLLKIEGPVDV